MEHAEVLRRLEREIELTGSVRRVATLFGVSPSYISAVRLNCRAVGPKLLKALGLRRRVIKSVVYEEVKRGKRRA